MKMRETGRNRWRVWTRDGKDILGNVWRFCLFRNEQIDLTDVGKVLYWMEFMYSGAHELDVVRHVTR
jgi:hypothetical protein